MRVLVTGGTGFIGRALCKALDARGDSVWVYSRRPDAVPVLCGPRIQAIDDLSKVEALEFDAVVNLAGESIAGGRWSDKRKQKLLASRIELTNELCRHLEASGSPPRIFVSGSATGYYGDGGDAELTEDSAPFTNDFAQELCESWELAADVAEQWGARVVKLRIGLVMGPEGGFLQPLKLPFYLGMGARLGSGRQWMSWVSLEDMVRIIEFVLDNERCSGIFNAVAPSPVTNAEFTKTFAKQLNRPAILFAPSTALKVALGELSTLLLASQRAVPERLVESGFEFSHDSLASALRASL
jgi:uncharacterized protein (TIGR01777 family)